VSDINPADVVLTGARSARGSYEDDRDDLESVPTTGGLAREGLPPGYRMRADAHYVEQLTSRTVERVGTGRELTVPGPAPSDLPDGEPTRARVMARLAEDLSTIASAAALLAADVSPMARRLNTDLIRAEAFRASWLLRAQGILDGTHRSLARGHRLGRILEGLRQGLEPECRMAGIDLHLSATDWNATVAVDESALAAGLTGAIVATLGLVGRVDGVMLTLSAEALGGDLRAVEVAQDGVAVPPAASARFFDLAWTDRPGGWLSGVGAAVARAVAEQHGGHARLLAGDRRGTSVRMTFARGV
jgi:hypothetical protein